MNAIALAATGVTHVYGETVALQNLDLEVRDGEFVALLGASGCGKSTLLNLFAGFERPSKGTISLMGAPIAGVEPRCGMVFQQYALFPWLSVKKNVAFGPQLRGEASERKVMDLLRTVCIEAFADHYPAQLSGGMRQRVALARVLANDPAVLLCDEPFAALDAMTRELLQEELTRLVAATKKTVVFVTHSIDEALLLADRIVVMTARPGRIKATFDNTLPRPRGHDQQLTPAYAELRGRIWELVKEEVLSGMGGVRR